MTHTRRSDASEKIEENSVSTFERFRLWTSFESSPIWYRLYRLKYDLKLVLNYVHRSVTISTMSQLLFTMVVIIKHEWQKFGIITSLTVNFTTPKNLTRDPYGGFGSLLLLYYLSLLLLSSGGSSKNEVFKMPYFSYLKISRLKENFMVINIKI